MFEYKWYDGFTGHDVAAFATDLTGQALMVTLTQSPDMWGDGRYVLAVHSLSGHGQVAEVYWQPPSQEEIHNLMLHFVENVM